MKIIITGASGMVGEGVLLHCLQQKEVDEILIINRKHIDISHPKLRELIVKDFDTIEEYTDQLHGYDACFYCAGISSLGVGEEDYTRITHDLTLHFAKTLLSIHADMVFNFVTGTQTDIQGRQMRQRVKGQIEQDLMNLGFRGQYNFRPGFMSPVAGQKHIRWFFRPFIWIFPHIFPDRSLTLDEVGQAMIHTITTGYDKQVLEIEDIRILAR